jgi:hypothetical protein
MSSMVGLSTMLDFSYKEADSAVTLGSGSSTVSGRGKGDREVAVVYLSKDKLAIKS